MNYISVVCDSSHIMFVEQKFIEHETGFAILRLHITQGGKVRNLTVDLDS